ncbi:MAG: RraA family protein, partial [Armatimonadetes bacterium]|nr:RraA family protein [Armatimonadota bacterium]
YWGEVQASVHKALGCAGTITNGGVRDLDEVRATGYHFFAGCVCVSHAYVHLVDFGQPVKVGGVVVRPGDLLHADQHGVLVVPQEIAADLPAAVAEVEREERQIIDYCRGKGFTLEGLKEVYTRARGKG